MIGKLVEVKVSDREIVRARAHHIEERSDAIKWTSNKQYAPFCPKLCLSVAFRVVRFHHPNTLVDKAFPCEPHVHQRLVELLSDVAIRAADKASQLFNVGSQECIT